MLKQIGESVIHCFASVPYIFGYIGRTVKSTFAFIRTKSSRKILIMQLLFTFIEALSLICVIATAMGSAIYIMGDRFLSSIGQSALIYQLLTVVITLELGPLIVAFIVIARSATAIATEIAGMVVSHQIESYISCGVDPIHHLVSPRFLGVTMSVFFLNLYFSFCGLIGPAFVQFVLSPARVSAYINGILGALSAKILLTSILKSIVFGMIISIVATYYGFNVERSTTEVPVAGISAVGKSVLGVIVADVFIIVLFYML